MTGVVVNVAVTLVVFAFAEAPRERAERSRVVQRAIARRFAFEAYYREHPPRPFLFYVFYPLLLPYVLSRPVTRRELLLYRGVTGGGVVILVAAAAFDFVAHWQPELGSGVRHRLGGALRRPDAGPVRLLVAHLDDGGQLHPERRLVELWALFAAAAVSVTVAVGGGVRSAGTSCRG